MYILLLCACVCVFVVSSGSFPFHYRGKVVASTDETESVVYGDIDLSEVDRVRSQIPVTHQKRWDLYSITDKQA